MQTAPLQYNTAVRISWLWNSSIVLQYNYETVWLWNSMAVRWPLGKIPLQLGSSAPLCSAPLHLLCSPLVQHYIHVSGLWCLSSSWRNAIFSLWWKGKVGCSSQRGANSYREKSPPLLLDLPILMTPNPHCLIGAKITVLIGWSGSPLIGWLRC